MKKYIVRIFIFTFMLFTNLGYAKRLDIYECANLMDAESCSRCKKVPSFMYTSWEFKINEKTGNVLRTVFYKDQRPQNDIFSNCKIFDENNWECNHTDTVPINGMVLNTDFKMLNGIFSTGTYSPYSPRFSKSEPSMNLCGK
jgi:hypothetical protein